MKNKQLLKEKEKDVTQISRRRGQRPIVICSQCKNENQKGSKFCHNCGAKLQSICPNCGDNNPDNSAFCSQCSSRLDQQVTEEIKTASPTKPGIVEDNFLECVLPEYDTKINYPATRHKADRQDLKLLSQ